jgi:hypothetical protein
MVRQSKADVEGVDTPMLRAEVPVEAQPCPRLYLPPIGGQQRRTQPTSRLRPEHQPLSLWQGQERVTGRWGQSDQTDPRTSAITAMSVAAVLEGLSDPVTILP